MGEKVAKASKVPGERKEKMFIGKEVDEMILSDSHRNREQFQNFIALIRLTEKFVLKFGKMQMLERIEKFGWTFSSSGRPLALGLI